MKRIRASLIATACCAALAGAAFAQTTGSAPGVTTPTTASTTTISARDNVTYLKRAERRFGTFAGSSANVDSLASGLRSGSEITLKGSGGDAIFTPPTKPMGYGNVTRALDLAQRQLAAAGITEPTPSEISAALNGGSVSTATGDVKLKGVLHLRSEGMGWGQIAHAIGVHPGMRAAKAAPASAVSTTGITTAAGGSVSRPGTSSGHGQKPAQAADRGTTVSSAAGGSAQASMAQSKGHGGTNAGANAGGKGLGRF